MNVAVRIVERVIAREVETAESGLGGVVGFCILAEEALLLIFLIIFSFVVIEGAALSLDFIVGLNSFVIKSFLIVVFLIIKRGQYILDLDIDLVHILKFMLVDLLDFRHALLMLH
jgi:hypothetical protein